MHFLQILRIEILVISYQFFSDLIFFDLIMHVLNLYTTDQVRLNYMTIPFWLSRYIKGNEIPMPINNGVVVERFSNSCDPI